MEIGRLGFDKKTAIFLGAGATRGAEFVRNATGAKPPLDADFFTQAQRLSAAKPKELIDQLIENAVTVFGNNFRLTMEGYLTRLEQLSSVETNYRGQGRPKRNRFEMMRENVLQVLAALLDESITREPSCIYHQKLVQNLSATDTILSLNYDWLVDYTLKKHAHEKWNPKIGYGVEVFKKDKGTAYWACEVGKKPVYPEQSVTLLKLHGSMNWFPVATDTKKPRLKLRQRWWHQKGKLSFEIVPPQWNKETSSVIYKEIWRTARSALNDVKAMIFLGYSLPETDLPVHALLAVEEEPDPLELLIVVNPDRIARERIRMAAACRLDKKTRVLSFETFQEFADFLDPTPPV